MTKTVGYDNKSETPRSQGKNSRLRDRNKCIINETSRFFVNAVEIPRSDKKLARPKILEAPFAKPIFAITQVLISLQNWCIRTIGKQISKATIAIGLLEPVWDNNSTLRYVKGREVLGAAYKMWVLLQEKNQW